MKDISTLDFSNPNFSTMIPLFNPMVQKFIVEKSGIEKLMVENLELKLGVEKSRVEMSFNQKDPPLNNTCNSNYFYVVLVKAKLF